MAGIPTLPRRTRGAANRAHVAKGLEQTCGYVNFVIDSVIWRCRVGVGGGGFAEVYAFIFGVCISEG